MRTTNLLLTSLLFITQACLTQPAVAGPAWKKLQVRYELTGMFDHKNLATGDIYYKFFGALFVSPTADLTTGTVSQQHGPLIGIIPNWRLKFDLRNNMFSNLDTRISCDNDCEIQLTDGGVLRLMKDKPRTLRREANLPLQARFMPELGEVPNGDLPPGDPYLMYSHHMRTIGCMGYREVAGKGYLANAVGALCINGTFSFPESIRSAPIEDMEMIKAQSNGTIVMHKNGK